jgi:hypothetical protein
VDGTYDAATLVTAAEVGGVVAAAEVLAEVAAAPPAGVEAAAPDEEEAPMQEVLFKSSAPPSRLAAVGCTHVVPAKIVLMAE